MSKTTVELELSDESLADLWGLSRAGVALYNAALAARIEVWEIGKQETRATQLSKLPQLCEQAGVEEDVLPRSVVVNLLSALDAVFFGTRDWRPRDQRRFWPLCWSADDIESSWSRLVLVALPSLRLPLPWVYARQGRATRVTISQDWASEQFSAEIEWYPVAPMQSLPSVLNFVKSRERSYCPGSCYHSDLMSGESSSASSR